MFLLLGTYDFFKPKRLSQRPATVFLLPGPRPLSFCRSSGVLSSLAFHAFPPTRTARCVGEQAAGLPLLFLSAVAERRTRFLFQYSVFSKPSRKSWMRFSPAGRTRAVFSFSSAETLWNPFYMKYNFFPFSTHETAATARLFCRKNDVADEPARIEAFCTLPFLPLRSRAPFLLDLLAFPTPREIPNEAFHLARWERSSR